MTDFYHGPTSGVADEPRTLPECDIAGRSYFYGDFLQDAYSKIEALEVGQSVNFISNAVRDYRFSVKRTK